MEVKSSGSDPLTRDDLRSAHQTRMALHRELIKRRPGEYSRRWLANRLGVSRRTINTYNHQIPIHTRPTYHESSLSWTTIDNLLGDEALAGAFIETLMGKKYPALRSIAAHLLAKGTYIRLKQRASNLYWYGSDHPPPNILPGYASVEPSRNTEPSPQRNYASQPYPGMENRIEPQKHRDQREDLTNIQTVGTRHIVSAALPTQTSVHSVGEGLRSFHSHTPAPLPPAQQEALAQTIYTHIDGLSLKNARQIATTYTEKNIRFALTRLQQRTNLTSPSGFFVSVLRSTARQM